MRASFLVVSLLVGALGVAIGGKEPTPGGLGEMVLVTDADDAQLFVDGRFTGTFGKAGTRLSVCLEAGEHQLRLTAEECLDLVTNVEVLTGKRITFRAVFGTLENPPAFPSEPIRIGYGQTMRMRMPPRPWITEYVFDGTKGRRIAIITTRREWPVIFKLHRGDRKVEVPLEFMKKKPPGLAGTDFFVATLPHDGDYRLTLYNRRGLAVRTNFRLCYAPELRVGDRGARRHATEPYHEGAPLEYPDLGESYLIRCFGPDQCIAVEMAKRVQALRLGPASAPSEAQERVGPHPVVGPGTRLRTKELVEARRLFFRPSTYDWRPAEHRTPSPAVGLRFHFGQRITDLLLCFETDQVGVSFVDEHQDLADRKKVHWQSCAPSRTEWVALVKSIFPEDAAIQALADD